MRRRTTISLNGQWELGEGAASAPPTDFPASVPVPGLVDLATPAFAGVALPVKNDSPRNLELSMLDVLEQTLVDPAREAFWYRRRVELKNKRFDRATLVVRKAKYGVGVWVNGEFAGEHRGNFTPAFIDVTDQLELTGTNEVLIRVGAGRDVPGASPLNGHDNEKLRYIPGIYDDVELVLSNQPRIDAVQVAPVQDLSEVIVRVTVDAGEAGCTSAISVSIKEDTEGAEVAHAELRDRSLPAGKSEFQLSVQLAEPKLWTPDHPFLYRAEILTEGDATSVRFGMRTFELLDGQGYLNRRPYRMLGTNICMYRFFEDSQRATLPWDREWARSVIREFKSMNWHSARFCIGFPPEFWYDIADEEGFLLQDEYPIWKLPERATVDDIAAEFGEWMQDRCNHPSVVIWDAQNETRLDEGGDKIAEAIRAVRTKDLQNRPWDNGWAPPTSQGDPIELHPYVLSSRGYTLRDIAAWPPAPTANQPYLLDGPFPPAGMIINEYGWMWINRDGSECILTERFDILNRLYPSVREKTPEIRLYLYARTIAALTEYWRARGRLAGLQHFCGLGYSRPNGHTSDSFADVAKAKLEPHFKEFVADAFAAVGVMLDLWDPPLRAGDRITIPAVVTNDRDSDFAGTVTLSVTSPATELHREIRSVSVKPHSQVDVLFPFEVPAVSQSLEVRAVLQGPGGYSVLSLRDIGVGDVPMHPNLP